MFKRNMLLLFLVVVLLLVPTMVVAQTCDDSCARGVHYYDGQFNERTSICSYSDEICNDGCDDDGLDCEEKSFWSFLTRGSDNVESDTVEIHERTATTQRDLSSVGNNVVEDDVESVNFISSNISPSDLIGADSLDTFTSLNTYTGSLKDGVGLASLSYAIDFRDGKKEYVVEIEFDIDYTKFGQYVPDGQKTTGYIWGIDLIFEDYSEALDTLNLIKDYQKTYAIDDISGFDDLYIDFQSSDCDMKEIDSSNSNYDPDYSDYKQVIAQNCRLYMDSDSQDYFKIKGYFAFWYDSLGWT